MSFLRKNLFVFFFILFLFVLSVGVKATPPSTPTINNINGNIGTTLSSNNNLPTVEVGNISDGDTVKIFIDSIDIGISVQGLGTTAFFSLGSTLSDNTHTITSIAYEIGTGDASSESDPKTYIVDTVAPSTPLISTIDSQTSPSTGNNPYPNVLISDLTVGDIIKLYINGSEVDSVLLSGTNVTLTPQVIGSTNTYTAMAIDTVGNTSPLSADFVYLFTGITPEVPTIISINGGTLSPVVSSTTSPELVFHTGLNIGTSYHVYSGGTIVANYVLTDGSAVDTDVNVSLPLTDEGSYSITMSTTDINGYPSPQSSPFVYNLSSPPLLTFSVGSSFTNQSPVSIGVTANKAISGFDLSDLNITNGVGSTFTTSDNLNFNFLVTPSAEGLVSINIAPTSFYDVYNNYNDISFDYNFTYDITPPSVPQILSVGGSVSPLTSRNDLNTALVYSPDFDALTINIGSSIVGTAAFVGSSGDINFEVNYLVNGPHYIYPKATDLAGNYAVGDTFVYILDNIGPGVSLTASYIESTNQNPLTIDINFADIVIGFDLSDINFTNGSGVGLSNVDNQHFILTVAPAGDGGVNIDIPESVCVDSLGNGNLSGSYSILYDGTPPSAPTIDSIEGQSSSTVVAASATPDIVVSGIYPTFSVKVFANGTEVASQNNIGGTAVTLTTTTLSTGITYQIIAQAIDQAGNTSPDSTSFLYSIDETVPDAPTIDSVIERTSSPITDSDSNPVIVVSNLVIGNNLKIFSGSTEIASVVNVGGTSISVVPETSLALGSNTLTAVSYSISTGNASDPSSPFVYIYDNQAPTVTSLGDNVSDFTLSVGNTAILVFNKPILYSKRYLIENSISGGSDQDLTQNWNIDGNILTITNSSSQIATFANDVFASAYDRSSNIYVDLKLIDSALESNQINSNDSVTVSESQNEVVINNSVGSTITIPQSATSSATINLSPVSIGQTTYVPNLIIDVASEIGNIIVSIPQSVLSSESIWNKLFQPPIIQDNSLVTVTPDSGKTATISKVIEIGDGNNSLTFDKAVRILIPGQGGKYVGFYRNSTFTKISNTCTDDTQVSNDLLAAGADCSMTIGYDLVVWTKHFTQFITYDQTDIPSNNNNNNNSGSSSSNFIGPPVCGAQAPSNAPTLFRIDRKSSTSVKIHFTPVNGQNTYYYIAFGRTEKDIEEYGTWFDMGQYPGEISFDINKLAKNKNYFFKVRGGNGCAPGTWSNTLSIKKKYFIPKDWINPASLIKKVLKSTQK